VGESEVVPFPFPTRVYANNFKPRQPLSGITELVRLIQTPCIEAFAFVAFRDFVAYDVGRRPEPPIPDMESGPDLDAGALLRVVSGDQDNCVPDCRRDCCRSTMRDTNVKRRGG
jgi:hypothetical protein